MRPSVFAALAALAAATLTPRAADAAAVLVTRDDAARLGADHGPGVALARAPRAAAQNAIDEATALPRPPTVTLAAGYRGGSLTPGPELGATVIQDVSLSGLGGARADVAAALTRSVDADTSRARLEAATRALFAYVGVLEASEIMRLRAEALAQAEAILATTKARVGAGVGQPFELAMAQGDAGAARASLLDAEGAKVEALAELRFALGMEPTADVDATGDLYASDERAADEARAVRAAEQSHPALSLARARAQLAREETRLASATYSAPLGVGASYVHEGTGDHVATAIVSVPLPFVGSAARYEAARQRATEQTAAAQVERVRAELARDVRLALHDREHWREVRQALVGHALAPMKEALRLARVQYEVGTHDVSTVLLARQRLVATEEQLARVAAEVQRADVRLARATGALVPAPASGGAP